MTREAMAQKGAVYQPYTPSSGAVATPPSGGFDVTIGSGTAPQQPTQQQQEEAYAASAMPPVKVAILLPLSGDQKDLGQAMLQAAQLALFDMGYGSFELMPRDTGDTPQGAVQATQSAIDNGAQLILGPLFASSVRAARGVAARYNINMITFSTDWTLAGGNTYVMGFLPFGQVQRITEYAAAQGLSDIGVFAPNTDYGNAVVASYSSLANRLGLNATNIARFSGTDDAISNTLRTFTRYDERTASAAAGGNAFPFQAVLLPVGGEQARSVANMLNEYDLPPGSVKRLGTGLWDDPGIAAEPALRGAWFAAPDPNLRRGFESRYRELYSLKPPRLATLAYDATALAAALARMGYDQSGQPAFGREALLNPNGFAGIDGIFRFRPDGMVERGLAVLEFHNGVIRVIDRAPTTFQQTGY